MNVQETVNCLSRRARAALEELEGVDPGRKVTASRGVLLELRDRGVVRGDGSLTRKGAAVADVLIRAAL